MAGRPPGAQNKSKPFKEALLIEAKLAEAGEESPAPRGSLRWIARQALNRAGEETSAAFQIRDTLDGKPAQAIIGGDEDDPAIKAITKIELVGVRPKR